MAEQFGERPVAEEVGAELISLMLPDMDPEVVRLILGRGARDTAGGPARHEDHRRGELQATSRQEYAELLALIRDAGIDRARLSAILGLDPEAR